MSGVLVVYRWELRKLLSQKRTYLGLGAAIAVPLIFVAALSLQKGQPGDVAFGAYVRESGLAIPLVLLLFGSIWLFPLIAALVAGDIIASEYANGTLKTILTRSLDRAQIFGGKAATAFTYGADGGVPVGRRRDDRGRRLVGLSQRGHLLRHRSSRPPKALLLVFAANACLPDPAAEPSSAIGVLLSTATRNSAAAVVRHGRPRDPAATSSPQIPGLEGIKPYLLTEQFQAWQGLLAHAPPTGRPIAHSAWVCALYAVPALLAGYLVFLRRDVAGG